MRVILCLVSLFIFSCAATEPEHHEPVMLVNVEFPNQKSQPEFQAFEEKYAIDVWRESKNSATAAVTTKAKQELEKSFKVTVLKVDIMKEVQSNIKENSEKKRIMERKRVKGHAITQYFATYFEITKWILRLQQQYPFVHVLNIGKTYEGRDTMVVKIGFSSSKKKKSAFIMSGIHAREWLAVASNVNFIKKLIMGARRDKRIRKLLKEFDFYILPVANPDGYIFTFRGSKTRLWRKTMRHIQNSTCIGVDPNRNFDMEFGTTGISRNPCTEIFCGEKAFSEKCTGNIAKFAKTLPHFKLFYDIHSYSQLFFVPYAFSNSTLPKDDKEIRRVANLSMTAMQKVNDRTFYLGSPAQLIYPASGSTIDYMYKVVGATYSFALETYPSFNARTGFLVRTGDINPSANEVCEAILVSAENIPS